MALLLIVLASAGGDGSTSESETGAGRQTVTSGPARPRKGARERSTYTVKPRDTLGGIAERTGVDVETIQELNPQLDPQALVAGQKIRLRE